MTKRIKILQVFTTLNRGGAETNFMNYLRHMDLQKFEIEIVVHRVSKGAYESELHAMGIVIHRLPSVTPLNYWQYKKQAKQLLLNGRYDIVHSQISELSVWLLKIAHQLQVNTRIVHAHSAWTNLDLKAIIRWYWKRRLPFYANVFFACNQGAAVWLFGKNTPYTLVKNAIDMNVFYYDETFPKQKTLTEKCNNQVNFCHVGSFTKVKNHRFLIALFKQYLKINPEAHLNLIGSGPLKESIKDQVNSNGISQKVHFIGSVSNVQDYLQTMDLMLFPSLFEGLPVSLIEAQAMGLPIVASDTISAEVAILPDLIQFVDLKAPITEWLSAIELGLSKQRKDTTQQILEAAYDIDSNVKKLEEVYTSLVQHDRN